MASATTLWARAFGSDGRLRLPRFFPLGQPPSLAFSLAASVLALDFTLPSNVPTFISFPQCGQFITRQHTKLFAMNHENYQSSPLPKIRTETNPVDMFTTEQVKTNLLRDRLITYVRDPANRAAWLVRDRPGLLVSPPAGQPLSSKPVPEPKPDAQNLLLTLKSGIQLDIFCATSETFATLLLCRTGSKEHNIWFAQRAIDHGGHWHPYKGLTLPVTNCHLPITNSGHIRAAIEEDLYRALKLDFIPPEKREIDYLRSLR